MKLNECIVVDGGKKTVWEWKLNFAQWKAKIIWECATGKAKSAYMCKI